MATIMPKQSENIAQFNNYQKMTRMPFVFYADTESALVPSLVEVNNLTTNTKATEKKHDHVTTGYCVNGVASDGIHNPFGLQIYTGDGAISHLINIMKTF
eukprot:Pompholyxophrys_punicea_v1_NODE_396_length_2062_cov_35.491281.p2 type:complete len:100 gc:universal NODE_396_length_2062_cov_35.491281:1563-1264(-)